MVAQGAARREFEENLPATCYFKNEKRGELPSDPVKLVKLKLMKQKTEANLKKEVSRLGDLNKSRTDRSQLFRMKKRIESLERTKAKNEMQLQSIRQRFAQMRNGQNSGQAGRLHQTSLRSTT